MNIYPTPKIFDHQILVVLPYFHHTNLLFSYIWSIKNLHAFVLTGVQAEMTQAVSRSRTAIMEAQQFKEQLGRKTHELENATAEGRRKEQDSDLTITRLVWPTY